MVRRALKPAEFRLAKEIGLAVSLDGHLFTQEDEDALTVAQCFQEKCDHTQSVYTLAFNREQLECRKCGHVTIMFDE
jgi:hypothetical protein